MSVTRSSFIFTLFQLGMMAESPIEEIGIFEVRYDQNRGLLIDSLGTPDGNIFYFKDHDKPVQKHCVEMQNIVRGAKIQRTKKLRIEISSFAHEYIRHSDNTVMFRGTKLVSAEDQKNKVYATRLNKEVGIAKRKQTMSANKQAKIDERNDKILLQRQDAELKYKAELKRRIIIARK